MSEQKIMSHMSEVGIAYQNNHDIDQPGIVNDFSSTLHKCLPIFARHIGCGILDDLNTPIYTLLKYSVSTPSNFSPQVPGLLNILR